VKKKGRTRKKKDERGADRSLMESNRVKGTGKIEKGKKAAKTPAMSCKKEKKKTKAIRAKKGKEGRGPGWGWGNQGGKRRTEVKEAGS